MWELPEVKLTIEKNEETIELARVISKKYTLSLGEKANLRKDLQSWRGRSFSDDELAGFDLQSILGVNCMIQIIHTKKNDKVYANISVITPLLKSIKPLHAENKIQFFSLEDSEDIPVDTPEWIKDIINTCQELNPKNETKSESTTPIDDDIPF
jgi:hypothetical protein